MCKRGCDPENPLKGTAMKKMFQAVLALVTVAALSGCAPLLIGGGAAVVADQAVEKEEGGDGLF